MGCWTGAAGKQTDGSESKVFLRICATLATDWLQFMVSGLGGWQELVGCSPRPDLVGLAPYSCALGP